MISLGSLLSPSPESLPVYKNHLNFGKEQEAAFISGKAKAGHGWSEFRSGKRHTKSESPKAR
jgi:hypothetical protein